LSASFGSPWAAPVTGPPPPTGSATPKPGICNHTWQRSSASCSAVDLQSDAATLDPEVMELLREVPRDRCGHLTSLGSMMHEEGECNPCQYWFKGVCINGIACGHCHFMHEGQRPRRLRPSKQGRLRLKKRMQQEGEDETGGQPGHSANALAAKLKDAAEASGLIVASAIPSREEQCANKISL